MSRTRLGTAPLPRPTRAPAPGGGSAHGPVLPEVVVPVGQEARVASTRRRRSRGRSRASVPRVPLVGLRAVPSPAHRRRRDPATPAPPHSREHLVRPCRWALRRWSPRAATRSSTTRPRPLGLPISSVDGLTADAPPTAARLREREAGLARPISPRDARRTWISGLLKVADMARVGPFSDLPLTFLRVPHHGSRHNLGPTILDRVLGPRDGVPSGARRRRIGRTDADSRRRWSSGTSWGLEPADGSTVGAK